jgi:hypothetical protein
LRPGLKQVVLNLFPGFFLRFLHHHGGGRRTLLHLFEEPQGLLVELLRVGEFATSVTALLRDVPTPLVVLYQPAGVNQRDGG